MAYGLCNTLATFQRAMQTGLEWHDCFVYIADVVSRTFKEHLQLSEQIFDLLRKANLRLKPKKCSFLYNEVTYVISVEKVHPDPEKRRFDLFLCHVT